MLKMLVGFSIGSLFAGFLLLGPLNASSTVAEEGEPVSGNVTEIDLSALDIRQMLTNAAGEITTADTSEYYEVLMQKYKVDEFPTPTLAALTTDPMSMLPDLSQVTTAAVTTPLEEAGKRIKDPELADFYWKLLGDAGWKLRLQ